MAKAKSKAKNEPKKKGGAPVGPAELVTLPMAQIDMAITRRVRDTLDQGTVDEYARTEAEWCETVPIDVFQGGDKCFGGDGGHRFAARIQCGRRDILCRVVKCGSAEEAFKAALRHAYSANAGHGRPRDAADKRKLIRDALMNPDHAELSNNDIALLCKVSHTTVSDVRQMLTNSQQLEGAAASTNPKRKPGFAKTKPDPEPDGEENGDAEGGRAATSGDESGQSDSGPEATERTGKLEVAARPPDDPGKAIKDARGRVVPGPLVPLFQNARAFVRDLRGTHAETLDAIKRVAEEPWGMAIGRLFDSLDHNYRIISNNVWASSPYVCCPHVNDQGEHELGGNCKVCIKNRGWLTKDNWSQLSNAIKAIIDDHAAPGAEVDDEPEEMSR